MSESSTNHLPDTSPGMTTPTLDSRFFTAHSINRSLGREGGYVTCWTHVDDYIHRGDRAHAVLQTDLRTAIDATGEAEERQIALSADEAREMAALLLSVADEVDRINGTGLYGRGRRAPQEPLADSWATQWMQNHRGEWESMSEEDVFAKLDRVRAGLDDYR